jgi:hypothetical protein
MRALNVIEIDFVAGGDAQGDAVVALALAIAMGFSGVAAAMAAAMAMNGMGVPIWWAAFPLC